MDLVEHLTRQKEWSLKTFGPGERTDGVIEHIKSELHEVQAKSHDIYEWIDVVLLAFDGAWRAGFSPSQVAHAITEKQAINELRKWPDWRTASEGEAIEHIKEPQP